jgi:hypothetical protein
MLINNSLSKNRKPCRTSWNLRLFSDAESGEWPNRQCPCGSQKMRPFWRHAGDTNCSCAPLPRRFARCVRIPSAVPILSGLHPPVLVDGSQGELARVACRWDGPALWLYTCLRMAWRFRKSIKLGPLRLNLSKSGIGTSIGVRGFRVGQDAKGRSYTAASIPGTGLYSRTYSSQGKTAGESAAGLPGAPQGQASGKEIPVGPLILAFMAGGLAVSVLMPRATVPPPVTPPAAVSAPVAPAQPIPAKRRRAHKPKPASPPLLRDTAQPGQTP